MVWFRIIYPLFNKGILHEVNVFLCNGGNMPGRVQQYNRNPKHNGAWKNSIRHTRRLYDAAQH